MKRKMDSAQLQNRLIDFASAIIDLTETMPASSAGKHLGGQILRSGTSPALNYAEAVAAESPADFVHKLKVCLKELRETHVCLKIIERRNWFQNGQLPPLLTECNELVAIFTSSTKTAASKKS